MLITFINFWGNTIGINPESVSHVRGGGVDQTHIIMANREEINIREEIESVIAKLNGITIKKDTTIDKITPLTKRGKSFGPVVKKVAKRK